MRSIYLTFLLLLCYAAYSQEQQQGNLFIQSNINMPVQSNQSKNYSNTVNLINSEESDNAIGQQQASGLDNFISNKLMQTQSLNPVKQANDAIISNGKLNDFSLNFSSRSVSFSSNKKNHRHAFRKKIVKLNRNLYGKMTLHKKSKHLVDVCFNWSK